MIASCPKCQSRYRVAKEKIGPQGARLRCSSCQTVFRIQAPEGADSETAASARTQTTAAPRTPKTGGAASAASLPVEVLICEADAASAKGIVELLARWGLGAETVDDGEQALLGIYRTRPKLVILGGHLPGVSGRTLAEVVRRTAELEGTKLVRVVPLDEPGGAPEFEADHTLEPADLPDGLESILERIGLGKRPAPVAPEPNAVAEPPSEASATPSSGRSRRGRPSDSADPEIAAAERLARIVVSDIILYNEEKFDEAVRTGKLASVLEMEIAEARVLFEERVTAALRAKRDFLMEELQVRARKRQGESGS